MLRIMPNLNVAFNKVIVIAMIDVNELLRISICKWKPTALYLHHHPVACFEGMRNVG